MRMHSLRIVPSPGKGFLAFVLFFMLFPWILCADEIRILDTNNIVRALKKNDTEAAVRISFFNLQLKADSLPLLVNVDGLASSIHGIWEDKQEAYFSKVPSGSWSIAFEDEPVDHSIQVKKVVIE